jgi:hypothetical protein
VFRTPAPRSSRKISARCPTSSGIAGAIRRARVSCPVLGALLAHGGAAVPGSRAVPARVGRVQRHPRHRTANRMVGARRRRRTRKSDPSADDRSDVARRGSAPGAVQPVCPRRSARSAVCVEFRSAAGPDSGRVRLARPHQRTSDDRGPQLDVQAAVAGRSAR